MLTKEQAEEQVRIVKERYPHTDCIVKHVPLERYQDRHEVVVYAKKLTGDQDEDNAIPHFTMSSSELEWFDEMLPVFFPGLSVSALLDWQFLAIASLLFKLPEDGRGSTKVSQVEDNALYLRPETWGQRRWHMIIGDWNDGLTLEQSDLGEKYHQRVTLEVNEIIPFVRWLLQWYLRGLAPEPKPPVEQLPAAGQQSVQENDSGLGEIEDHPF